VRAAPEAARKRGQPAVLDRVRLARGDPFGGMALIELRGAAIQARLRYSRSRPITLRVIVSMSASPSPQAQSVQPAVNTVPPRL